MVEKAGKCGIITVITSKFDHLREAKMDLNIIGNGFDLYHGLPSSYYYFACYLIKNNPDFYFEMGNMYAFQTAIYSHKYEECEPVVDFDLFWSQFEERLGYLSNIWLEDSLIDDLYLEYPDDAIDIEIPETANSDTIVHYFIKWVADTLETKLGVQTILKMLNDKKLTFSEKSFFVNFNYTSILESVYGISSSDILYIHGKVRENEDSDLILGHGNQKGIEELKKKIGKIESEGYFLSSQAERNRLNEYKAEKTILENLKKQTELLVNKLKYSLRDKLIDNIYIYGLSCGNVDMPYMQCLREIYPNATWHFSYYNENEKSLRTDIAKRLRLSIPNVKYFLFSNNSSEKIKQKIIDKLSLQTFRKIG